MGTITKVHARQVLDSRGNPTIEVEVSSSEKGFGRAIVPSGASTGSREAIELRDQQVAYGGKSVMKAVENVNALIGPALVGYPVSQQQEIDQALIQLDGTANKSKLGANAILGASMAVAVCSANETNNPLFKEIGGETATTLPVPMMNILNGGQHANNSIDIQEFMIMPTDAKHFTQALQMGAEVFQSLKKCLDIDGYSTAVGDEGGFAPSLENNEKALQYIIRAINEAGYDESAFRLAIDVAASEFYENNTYKLDGEKKQYTAVEMIDYLEYLTKTYPIISIEDGLDESDWDGWAALTNRLGRTTQLVGDDLFVTNPSILEKGVSKGIANSILIKLNQIGTVTETLQAIQIAKDSNYTSVISHRSGESEDVFIADLAVATNAGQIKTGSLCRADRVAKYNQLLRIEEQLNSKGSYPGLNAFCHLLV